MLTIYAQSILIDDRRDVDNSWPSVSQLCWSNFKMIQIHCRIH